jgi:isoleucyl-tRNA synthetase
VRQPLKKIMIPVLDEITRNEIIAVSDLIKSEVNVKEIELIDEGSGILVKQIKPNFKKLGPHFGKDMKVVAQAIGGFDAGEISLLEKEGKISISVNEKNITLTLEDVEISSQDIEGWLVANNNGITVALDVTITPNLKNEGIARELVNRIQNIRKDAGYEVTDRVEVRILENEILEVAVQENMDYIKQETLTEVLKFVGELEEGTDIAFDDITTKLNIVKH